MSRFGRVAGLIPLLFLLLADPAYAAGDLGRELSLLWVIPFAGILLSIALFPLLAPRFWHHHFGKVSLLWALLFLVPFAAKAGVGRAVEEVLHVYILEFIPFIILLWALYTCAGGVRLKGRIRGTPLVNTGLIALGTALASWMGTTGAAMLIIRPLLRANAWRKHRVHVVIFFIFLVANIGGSLTPLGDPPLFLGFLHGVSFFWTTEHLLAPMMVCVVVLLALFFFLDSVFMSREDAAPADVASDEAEERLGVEGGINFLFLLGVITAILYSGYQSKSELYWDQAAYAAAEPKIAAAQADVDLAQAEVAAGAVPVEKLLNARIELNRERGAAEHHAVRGIHISEHVTWPYVNLVRDGVLILMGILSLMLTARRTRRANDFTWFPIVEVAKLFSGIFVTIIPAIAILKAGPEGALRAVVMAVTKDSGEAANCAYFWFTGGLSSFLDNAPTYLVFFNTAGGNAAELMTTGATTLLAVSAGAVFLGAMTYIGNAPNFMVRSIAEEAGVPMPSFFGYMIRWSVPVLIPTFLLVTVIFFL